MTDNERDDLSSQPTQSWSNTDPAKRPTVPPASTPDQPTISSSAQRTVQSQPTESASTPTRSSSTPPSSGWRQAGYGTPPPAKPPLIRRATPQASKSRKITTYGIFKILFFVGLFAVVALVCSLAVSVVGYVSIASSLPSPTELEQRATQLFTSSQIYDRNGDLLYELVDPQGGRRTSVPLDKISPWLTKATIATEDPRFYRHPGFDLFGIARAIVQNIREGDTVSGASTIAQQLVRNLMLPEGSARTATRKVREAVLAAEVTRQYPRDKILELYLNSINYGNLAYGIEAAARTYFNKDAAELTLAEASFLAGIPQSPAVYDPYTPEGRDAALARQKVVLRLMQQTGDITADQAKIAAQAMEQYTFKPPDYDFNAKAPHWVVYIRQLVEKEFGPEALYRGGLKIYTTLDPQLQAIGEQTVREQVAALAEKNVKNGALVSMDPRTGEILAMVGSPDFNNDAIGGQINMTLHPRQTGSVIKPITYLAAFEKGWTPATVLWDMPVVYTDTAGNIYSPVNYDGKFHGPQSVRSALANSYNIPAVKTLVFDGIPNFLALAQRLGIDTLTRPDYGPALTLGGGEVPLLEMTDAFGTLANNGVYMPPVALLHVDKADGTPVCEFTPPGQNNGGVPPCQIYENAGQQIVNPQHAYLLSNILSDNAARTPAFGPNSVLKLSRPAAVKTGTTNDYKDNWTIGYTPDLVTGVWVGNADNKPMQNVSGVSGAGPIWHNFMEAALKGRPVIEFVRPPGLVEKEVCADSGTEPSPYCPNKKLELFAADQPPLPADKDWYQMVSCGGDQQVRMVLPDDAYAWALQQPAWQTLPIASQSQCAPSAVPETGNATILITSPAEGSIVNGNVPIVGTVQMPNFDYYDLKYGAGVDPDKREWISGPHQAQVTNGPIGEWNTAGLDDGEYTLFVIAHGKGGEKVEYRAHVRVQNNLPAPTLAPTLPGPTETPIPVPTETLTAEPTLAPTATPTSQPTVATPVETPTPTPTPVRPSETALPTPAETLTPTPIHNLK